MSSANQIDLDWAGTDAGQSGAGVVPAGDAIGLVSDAGAADARFLSDEEILGIDPPSPKGGYGGLGQSARGDSSGEVRPRNDREPDVAGEVGGLREGSEVGQKGRQAEAYPTVGGSAVMPAWMVAASGDPNVAGEAAALWAEHQEMRAAVVELRGVAEEARAIKELLPGGVRDIVSLREATASVERIDAALFSGDARAQADVVGEMARVNPAAFRAMFAEAARVMAGMGTGGREAARREAGGAGQEGNFKFQINSVPL